MNYTPAIKAHFFSYVIPALLLAAGPACAQQWDLLVDAQPRRISADARSTSQISVTVTSMQGSPAPDGTEVRFNTTDGDIVPVARTVGGKATGVLTSGNSPNIAQVTAIVGGASGTTDVEFVSGEYQPPEIVLRFDGEVAYSIDEGTMLAADSTLRHGDLTISANSIEFHERRGQVRAQGDVAVTRGDVTLLADALWYTPDEGAGAILIAGREPTQVAFRSENLDLQTAEKVADTRQFEPFQMGKTRSWIRAESAIMWPRDRIQFTRAEVLVHERPVLQLPHYFYEYRGTALNPISQQLRYTAYEGLVVDLPFYFQFHEQRSSGLRVRYAGRGSSYGGFTSPRKGFSLGLEQSYTASGGGGRLFLDDFISADRSLEFNHAQDLNRGRRLNANFRYQPLSDFAKNSISGNASYAFSRGGLDYTAAVYGNRSERRHLENVVRSSGRLTTRLDARSRSQRLGGTGLSWRASGSLVRGPVGTTQQGLTTGFYQTMGVALAHRPISLGFANLTLDSAAERAFGARNTSSIRARAVLSRPIGSTGDLTVSWDQEFSGGTALSSAYRKSLTAAISAGSFNGLHGYAYYSWIPDNNSSSLTANASMPLMNNFRLDMTHTFSSAGYEDALGDLFTSRFSYTRLSLARPMGILELSVNWSPQGRDYGLRRGQKFWFEIGSRAF